MFDSKSCDLLRSIFFFLTTRRSVPLLHHRSIRSMDFGPHKLRGLHSSKLTWQWKIPIFNREYIFNRSIFHCHVSLLEGTVWVFFSKYFARSLNWMLMDFHEWKNGWLEITMGKRVGNHHKHPMGKWLEFQGRN